MAITSATITAASEKTRFWISDSQTPRRHTASSMLVTARTVKRRWRAAMASVVRVIQNSAVHRQARMARMMQRLIARLSAAFSLMKSGMLALPQTA